MCISVVKQHSVMRIYIARSRASKHTLSIWGSIGDLFKLGNFLSPSDMSVLQTWILISNSLTLEHSPVRSRRMFSHHSSDGAYRCQTLSRLWSYNKWELCDWKYKVMWQIAIMMMIWNVFADKWLRLINRLWRITRTTSAAGMIPCMRFA